jgi:hypothetical protein
MYQESGWLRITLERVSMATKWSESQKYMWECRKAAICEELLKRGGWNPGESLRARTSWDLTEDIRKQAGWVG